MLLLGTIVSEPVRSRSYLSPITINIFSVQRKLRQFMSPHYHLFRCFLGIDGKSQSRQIFCFWLGGAAAMIDMKVRSWSEAST
jgi:hypothetical protein